MKKNLLLLFLIMLSFVSCKTTETLYTAMAADSSQINFLRPFDVDTKKTEIDYLSMDLTVTSNSGNIVSNPVLNYTFRKSASSAIAFDDIAVGFACGNTEIMPIKKSVLYRDVTKDNKLEIRYTSELDKDFFTEKLKSSDPWSILLVYPDGSKMNISSKELDDRILKLKIVL